MRRFLVFSALVFIISCGYRVKEKTTEAPKVSPQKNVVILPFSSYIPDLQEAWWLNNVIVETLQDELFKNGFVPAVQEDVYRYLMDKKVIKPVSFKDLGFSPGTRLLISQLNDYEMDETRRLILEAIRSNLAKKGLYKSLMEAKTKGFVAADKKLIKEMGEKFGADFVIRGRIIAFERIDDDIYNPAQIGLLPFIFKVGQRVFFGVSSTESYEFLGEALIGTTLGVTLGSDDEPFEGDDETNIYGHPRLGKVVEHEDEEEDLNRFFWGALGFSASSLAHKGGRVKGINVKIRMIVQDTRTGKVVWMGKTEVETMQESLFSRASQRDLVTVAVERGVKNLVKGFLNYVR